jgi:transposase-like protein
VLVRRAQKTGVKAVCAKYDICDQTYRVWRYKAQGIKPRKHFSSKKKLKILEEGARDGVCRTCADYRINPTTYYDWRHKLGFTKLPSRPGRPERFGDEQKLAILKEGSENGILRTCTALGISISTYYHWKRKLVIAKARDVLLLSKNGAPGIEDSRALASASSFHRTSIRGYRKRLLYGKTFRLEVA